MTNIKAHVEVFNRLRDAYARSFDLDRDDPAIIDTVEGETDITAVIQASYERWETIIRNVESLKDYIARLDGRAKDMSAAAKTLKQDIAEAMLDCGMKTLRLPMATLTAGTTKPGVEITPEALPDAYKFDKVTTVRVPDRDMIAVELEAGLSIPGVRQHNGKPMLTVRV